MYRISATKLRVLFAMNSLPLFLEDYVNELVYIVRGTSHAIPCFSLEDFYALRTVFRLRGAKVELEDENDSLLYALYDLESAVRLIIDGEADYYGVDLRDVDANDTKESERASDLIASRRNAAYDSLNLYERAAREWIAEYAKTYKED